MNGRGTVTERASNVSLLDRVLRYGCAGTAISIVYSLAVLGLAGGLLRHRPTAASALAFFVVLPVAYAIQRRFTFADATPDSLQFLRFTTVSAASLLVAVCGMYVTTEILRRSILVGLALNWLLIPSINFMAYLVWVFRVRKPAPHVAASRS